MTSKGLICQQRGETSGSLLLDSGLVAMVGIRRRVKY